MRKMLMNPMLLLVTVVFHLVGSYSVNAQMRSVYIDSQNPENGILKLSLYSQSEGFIAFDDWLGYTIDSGRTVQKKFITPSNVNFNGFSVNLTFGFTIAGVKAFSQNNVLLYGGYGLVPSILRSTDGGNSFTLLYHSQFNPTTLSTGITDMCFPENNTVGYAVDADRILKTTNQGLTWSAVRIEPNSFFTNIEGVDNNNIYVLSTEFTTNKLLKTNNAGLNWQQVILPVIPGGKMNYAHFVSPNFGWVSMYGDNNSFPFYKTNNGGATWTQQNDLNATPFGCSKMVFADTSIGYAITSLFQTYKTFNSGVTWEQLPRTNNYQYLNYGHNDLQLIESSQLWAGGGHGFLELTTNAGGTPFPGAFFNIDTTGVSFNNTVNLRNFSRNGYNYQWMLNGTALSNNYNSNYQRDVNRLADTITLVVSNGTVADTAVKVQYFFPLVKILSFSPTTAATGNTVLISGLNFENALTVSFGNVPASSFTVTSDTSISAVVGAGSTGLVKVTTPTGRDSLGIFNYLPSPVITSFNPISAVAGATVTITGVNFTNVINVSFEGVPATSFVVVNDNTINAVVPSGQSGAITVTTAAGSASLTGYVALPTILSFTPTSGTAGTIVTINGTSLSGVISVSFGAISATSFTVNSSTSIVASVGTGATGNVTVTKPGGVASLPGFIWQSSPTITSFTPSSGPVGTVVTITGTGFNSIAANNIVYFGAVKAGVISATNTSLTVSVPVHATYEPITVTNNNLVGYSSKPFLVTFSNGGSITASSFSNRTTISLGTNIRASSIKAGDLDGDGKPDIITIAGGSLGNTSGLYLFRNTSNLTSVSFAAPQFMGAFENIDVALGDLDGDGKIDLVISQAPGIGAFLNTSTPGNISFGSGVFFATDESLKVVAIKDLDGDGKADIVGGGNTKTTLFRNTSNPGLIAFAPRITYDVRAVNNLLLTDLNGDNKPEIVGRTDDLTVLKNNSTVGNFNFELSTHAPGIHGITISEGDVDGDGKTDIITGESQSSTIYVIRNTSTASTISLEISTSLICQDLPSGNAFGDLDGDGKIDIAAGTNSFSTNIFKNTSTSANPAFASKVGFTSATNYGFQNYTVIVDINGDGKNDIVQSYGLLSVFGVHLNEVNQAPFVKSFDPTIGVSGTTVTIKGNNLTGVTAVSFGGVNAANFVVTSDTAITAVLGGGASGIVSVTNGFGTGTNASFVFGIPPVITQIAPAFAPIGASITITGNNFSTVPDNNQVFFGDVKAIVTSASPTVLVATVPIGATHQPIQVIVNRLTAFSSQNFSVVFQGDTNGFNANSFAAPISRNNSGIGTLTDIDGDGKLDLLMTTSTVLRVALNTSTAGNISFGANQNFTSTGPGLGVTAGDLDGDGKKDVLIYNDDNSITIFKNNSTINSVSFGTPVRYILGYSDANPQAAQIIDVDKDGKSDIIVSNYTGYISVFKNLSEAGNIILDTRLDFNLVGYGTGLGVRDLNGDGKSELIGSVNGVNLVSAFTNLSTPGSISFSIPTNSGVGNWPISVAVTDIDGDAKLDIVTANINDTTFSVIRNNSSAGITSLSNATNFRTLEGPLNATVGDMDGDGKPDVVVTNIYSSNSVSVFRNLSTPGNVMLQQGFAYSIGNNTFGRNVVGDLDGDGVLDITVFLNSGVTLFFKNQMGGFVSNVVCSGRNTSITTNLMGTAYQWQQNTGSGFANISNSSIFNGANAATLQISNIPLNWSGYQYRCLVNNTNFSVVTILNVANTPVANAGRDTVLCVGSSVQLQGSGGTTYSWSPTSGLNNPSIAGPTATPLTSTNYIVTVSNGGVCTAIDTVRVTVLPNVTPTINISSTTSNLCAGNPITLTATVSGQGPNPVYQWRVNGVNLPNSDTNRLTIPSLQSSGVYSATLTSDAACVSNSTVLSNSINIIVSQLDTPLIAQNLLQFSVLNPDAGATYVWQVKQNNDWINVSPSALGTSFLAPTDGNYRVNATKGACSLFSFPLETARSPSITDPYGINTFPNPANGIINFDPLRLDQNWESIDITNGVGTVLLTLRILNLTRLSLNISSLPPGIYFARLKNTAGLYHSIIFIKQ